MTIDISESKVAQNEMGMWLEWTLATAFGMLLGFLPSIIFVNSLDLALARIIVPLFAGFLVGLAQWFVLRKYVNSVSDWIWSAGASWAVGYALGLLIINGLTGTGLDGYIGYILFGAIVGLVQWPVLRREIPNVWIWILANVIGWTAGFFLSQVALDLFFNGPAIAPVASTAVISGVSGLVAGAITGVALVMIVRQPERV
ncbi:MAG TPA: hypothetical protein VFQ23_23825 [Anaerolineales bacterium]|nr:hypothetical protein [Anaerolineales bacterium]